MFRSTILSCIRLLLPYLEQSLADNVLHSNQSSVGFIAIIDHTLAYIFVEMRAIMMSFHLSIDIPVIEVECAEMLVELLQRCKALDGGRLDSWTNSSN